MVNDIVKLKDLLKDKEYSVIECRMLCKQNNCEQTDTLVGFCTYVDGKLYSLDGDDYSLETEISKYEERIDEKGHFKYLIVWEKVE